MRWLLLPAILLVTKATTQPVRAWTSASANAQAWDLHRRRAHHRTVKGGDMALVQEAMGIYRPLRHQSGRLQELTHVAMVFSGGRPTALGVADDLGRVIDFTARKEYRISTVAEHLQVRALLSRLVVE